MIAIIKWYRFSLLDLVRVLACRPFGARTLLQPNPDIYQLNKFNENWIKAHISVTKMPNKVTSANLWSFSSNVLGITSEPLTAVAGQSEICHWCYTLTSYENLGWCHLTHDLLNYVLRVDGDWKIIWHDMDIFFYIGWYRSLQLGVSATRVIKLKFCVFEWVAFYFVSTFWSSHHH